MNKSIKHVIIFFVLAFAQTWIFYFAIILTRSIPLTDVLGTVFLICGGMAPSLIGIIMMFATYSKDDRKEYFRRSYQVKRISVKWWIFILLIFPVIYAVTVLVTIISGAKMPEMEGFRAIIQNPVSIIVVLLIGFFINGAFPEEFGWRGFALQPLLDKLGFFRGNLLLGILWGIWHLPLFFIPSMWFHSQLSVLGLAFYIAHAIGLSMMMCLVFIKTRQSILSALLMHMFSNLVANQMGPYSDTFNKIIFGLVFIFGIGISVYIRVSKTGVSSQSD